MNPTPITALFLDVGGVLLTNGWDRIARSKAAAHFELEFNEMDERHHLTFDTYEEGKISLDEYLSRVIFYQPRTFTRQDFKDFMFAQSQPFPQMIELVRTLKARYNLRVAVVSNEGRELTEYRINKFKLREMVDTFVCSCYVHFRKPDDDMFRIALDLVQVAPAQVVYIEDRPMFVQEAADLGICAIHHTDFESTRAALISHGLSL